MSPTHETADDPRDGRREDATIPGLVLIAMGARPALRALPLLTASPLAVGREGDGLALDDGRASRRHAEVRLDGGRWSVRDLGSRNGTFLDGRRVEGETGASAPGLLRVGASLFMLLADVRPYAGARVESGGAGVVGPVLRQALRRVELAARAGRGALVIGESGAGKELAARAFHAATERPGGPFVAVNCAAIPEGVAERLLFGATKGAYSGATADSSGYIEAASGGTLFLDEMGELDLAVQAKLLRVLETREVLPLGASKPRRVDVRLCCATHRDLRAAAAEGRFRPDLYYRIAQPEVRLPPLRERREEVPWLVAREVAAVGARLETDGRFLEACALRPWPGNVRELLAAVREAAHHALEAGAAAVTEEMLPPAAGLEMAPRAEAHAPPAAGERAPRTDPATVTREQVEAALAKEGGQMAAAARSLGLHRTQLYRLVERFGIGPKREG